MYPFLYIPKLASNVQGVVPSNARISVADLLEQLRLWRADLRLRPVHDRDDSAEAHSSRIDELVALSRVTRQYASEAVRSMRRQPASRTATVYCCITLSSHKGASF